MKGLEISKAYWTQCGRPLFEEKLPELMPYLAVGLLGSGSECYGYDDEISRDHDFEPGFMIFLPSEDIVSRREAFLAERAYTSLPGEFMGVQRNKMNPAGGNRHGVFRMDDFLESAIGIKTAPVDWREWLGIPDYALSQITNGEVFYDGYGEFSKIRSILDLPPEDVQKKKLCGFLLSASQTGEYNYARSVARNDEAAALLTAAEFVNHCLGAAFWIYNRPMPYYKWRFRALKDISGTEELYDSLLRVLKNENTKENIEKSVCCILSMTQKALPGTVIGNDLQKTARSLNDGIRDSALRNLGLLAAI